MKKKSSVLLPAVLLTLAALLWLSPFYISFVYAAKAPDDMAFGRLGPPSYLYLDNFIDVITENELFLSSFVNSVLVTVPIVILLQVICSTGAYVLARNNSPVCKLIYGMFVASILIPFQAVMLGLYQNLQSLDLINTHVGFIIVRTGFTVAFNIMIITAFIKTVPPVLEEAASIDGAGRIVTFWRVVYPMMQPVNVTVMVLNVLFTWNDFNIALIILQKSKVRTLPMAQYVYFGESTTNLNMAFAFAILSMIPVIILYLVFQRYIVEGIASGAVKG